MEIKKKKNLQILVGYFMYKFTLDNAVFFMYKQVGMLLSQSLNYHNFSFIIIS